MSGCFDFVKKEIEDEKRRKEERKEQERREKEEEVKTMVKWERGKK